jgi:hypothetical protein
MTHNDESCMGLDTFSKSGVFMLMIDVFCADEMLCKFC